MLRGAAAADGSAWRRNYIVSRERIVMVLRGKRLRLSFGVATGIAFVLVYQDLFQIGCCIESFLPSFTNFRA